MPVPPFCSASNQVAADQSLDRGSALGREEIGIDVHADKQRAAQEAEKLKTFVQVSRAQLGDVLASDQMLQHDAVLGFPASRLAVENQETLDEVFAEQAARPFSGA